MFYHPNDALMANRKSPYRKVSVTLADKRAPESGRELAGSRKESGPLERPHFMPLSRLLCWASGSIHFERVGVDGSIEFLVRSSGWTLSPAALHYRPDGGQY